MSDRTHLGHATPAAARRRLALVVAVVALAAAGTAGCPMSSRVAGPPILLITLDTTRADRIGAYGYADARTPVLDRLAARGILFEHAYAPVPLTLPSHASMLTGDYPAEHGLRTNGAGSLPESTLTLAELLSDAGYETAAFVASYVLDHKFGLAQGFSNYDDNLAGAEPTQDSIHRYRDGARVVDSALQWLHQERQHPFFCWVHLYDPHEPYDPRSAEFDGAFDASPYDGEIAYVDRQIGRLVEFAEAHPDTIVIVAGDHGEGLGDHSELQHGYTLYRSVLHVPLVVAGASQIQTPARIATPVSLIDLFPTVLQLARQPVPDGRSGVSLVDALGGQPLPMRPLYAMTDDPFLQNGWSPLRALTLGDWRYIRTAKPELYNLTADPGELTNLADAQPDRVQELEAALADLESELKTGDAAEVQLSAAEKHALASLGYLGGTAGPIPEDLQTLPDVKDMLPFNVRTESAIALIEQRRLDEAEAILTRVMAESPPEHYVSRICLGSLHEARGNVQAAEDVYRDVLKHRPDNTSALYPLGSLCAEQGRLTEALQIFEHCLSLQPDAAQPLYNRGLVRARMGDLLGARQDLTAAIQRDAQFVGAWAALGNVYTRMGALADAQAAFETELSINPDSVEGHVNLAVLLFNAGQHPASRRHLEEAVRLAPDNLEARMNLAICCETQGDARAAIAQLEAILDRKPDHEGAAAKLQKLRRAPQ